jgi:PAS domain S-box-containing protein
MEVSLIQTDSKKDQILESIEDGFFSLDRRWSFNYINRKAAKIVGMEPEELIGKVIWEVSPEISGTDLEKVYRQAMERQVAQRIEMKVLFTGSWYNINAFPSVEGISVYWRDISKQKQIEMELHKQTQEMKQREAEYLDMIDSIIDGSWVVDCVNGTIQCSQQWAKRIGLNQIPEEDRLAYTRTLIHPDDKMIADVIYSCFISKKPKFDLEYRIKTVDKGYIWTQNRGKITYDETGNPLKVHAVTFDITEVKEAETALRKSEERYRRLFGTMDEGFSLNKLVRDHQGQVVDFRVLEVNRAFETHTGFAPAEVVGRLHTEVNPSGYEQIIEACALITETCEPTRLEQYNKGLKRWLSVRLFPYGNDKFALMLKDISERKRAEEVLRESEKRQSFLLKLNDSIMMLADPIEIQCMAALVLGYHLGVDRAFFSEIVIKDGIEYCSIEHIYHVPHAPLPSGLYPLEIFGKLANEYHAGRNIIVYDLETEPLIEEDERINFRSYNIGSWVSVPLFKNSKFVAVFTVQNTTPRMWTSEEIELMEETAERTWVVVERTKAEVALQESEDLLSTVLENSRDGISMLDLLTGCYVFINQAQMEQTGLNKNEINNISFKEICKRVHNEDRETYVELHKLAATGHDSIYNVEYRWKVKNGEYRWFSSRCKLIRDSNAKPESIVEISRDITERKKAEEMIGESKERALDLVEKLRQQDQNKNTFLNMLSHELRNPLASIMMSLSLQNQVPPGGEEDIKARKVMERQTAHLSRLVDDLLDITRITQNKITLKKERVELNQLVKVAVADYQASFIEKEVGLKIELTSDLLFLEADPARLTQIIGNLLHNASKFTSKGDQVFVTVYHDESTQEAIIKVKDNGIGIKPEILPNLFEPFMQVDSTLDRSNGGLGLGLAIVKGMVELHKGSVSVHSEGLGKGTRLQIRLPLTAVETGKKEQGSKTGCLSANPFRILIIDDIPDIAEILSSLLSYLGHEVATAFSGPEGIAKAKEFQPKVVICDIGLPGMNGYEVAKSFRSDQELKDTFLIALSGYAQPEDLERSREAGFKKHLAKPVNLETLEQVLAEVSLHK